MSILNKEFYLNEAVTNWNDWNGQSTFVGSSTSKGLEKVNKLTNDQTPGLVAACTSLARSPPNSSPNTVASIKVTKSDQTFGSVDSNPTINSSHRNPNEPDKMTSLKREDLLSDNRNSHRNENQNENRNDHRNDHRKDHRTDASDQASPDSNSPRSLVLDHSNERPTTNESENIDFTSLHNDVISLADQEADAAGGQSNCLMPSISYPFGSPSSNLASPASSSLAPRPILAVNPSGLSNLTNSSVSNSSISSTSLSSSSSLNAHLNRPHPNHQFNCGSPQVGHHTAGDQLRHGHPPNRSHQPASFNQPMADMQQSLNVDDGLTSLSWLQNLSMTRLGAPTPPASPLCNLMPNYFSGISPQQSTCGPAAGYSSQAQYQLSAAKASSKSIKNENGRKSKHCKSNGSKSKATTNRRMNKPNCQNAADSSIGILSSPNGQMIDATRNAHRSADYAEPLSSSLDLTCNGGGGDRSALQSNGYSCNEMNSRPNDLSGLNGSSLGDADSLSREHCDQFPSDQIDYDLDDSTKPPFSYAALICMAMKSNHNKMTLRAIYKWIREKFIYYRKASNSWENSIRHNLSLNKCFIKIPRGKEEPGKGGFWRLDPIYADSLVNGVFKKRKQPKSELDATAEVSSEKKSKKKERSKKSESSVSQPMEYCGQQTLRQVCQANDNLMMHDTPPNSAESYSTFIENQTDIEITSAVNSIDHAGSLHRTAHQSSGYLNPPTSISKPSAQPQLINDCSLTQCNPMNGDSTHSLQPVHLVNASNQLATIASHQLVGQATATPNHYMIHLTNANSQDPQTITIEPMTNGLQSLHSSNGCAFTGGELTQLTSLQATGNEVCLDGSGINLTALTNGQLPESCLLASDTDICWNTILTDELRLVDTIGSGTVYSTNHPIPLTAIPISSQPTAGQVLSPVADSQQTSSAGAVVTSSISGSISGPISNVVPSSSSQSPSSSSANLLAADNAQVQNLILNSTSSSSICTTSYCMSTSDPNQFANSIGVTAPMNGQHLNGETVVNGVVTCAVPGSVSSSANPHHQLSSWDANGNYMSLVYSNQSATAGTELTASNGTTLNNATINPSLGVPSVSSASLNSAATLNCASAANENHGSPVVIQINSNGLGADLNCAHQFDSSNSMPTWIECTLQGSLPNGKVAFESNAFDLDSFSDLDNC